MSEVECDVLEPLRHDGTRYEPGAVAPLPLKRARQLEAKRPRVVRIRRDESQTTSPGDRKPVEPQDPAERHQVLVSFMADLEAPEDPKGSDFWTNSGKPDCFPLAEALGWDSVSAAERDDAWQAAQSQDGGGVISRMFGRGSKQKDSGTGSQEQS